MSDAAPMAAPAAVAPRSHWQRYRTLYAILAVCIAPVLASYFAYYVMPPSGRTNYGDLVQPQRPTPALTLSTLDGRAVDAASLRGQWVMLQVGRGVCDAACQSRMLSMRQLRLMTGKEMDRIGRVWLITDDATPAAELQQLHQGAQFLRARREELATFLPLAEPAAPDARIEDHIWLIDPLGNLMMRFPKDPDPKRVKRDLDKLLRASRIG